MKSIRLSLLVYFLLLLGIALGAVSLLVFAMTVFHVLAHPVAIPLALLSQYFYGYDTSWRGAFC